MLKKMNTDRIKREEDGVENLQLTSSHENNKITTNCWTTINKKYWNLPKNTFYIQRQGRNHNEMVGGVHLRYNQIPYPLVGNSQTEE